MTTAAVAAVVGAMLNEAVYQIFRWVNNRKDNEP